MAEILFQLLKQESIRRNIYTDREAGRQDIFDYIELFYNPKRRHGYADGVAPVEFESSITTGSRVSTEAEAIELQKSW